MDQDTVIKVEHVSKKFCKSLKRGMLHGVCDIARNAIGLSAHSEKLRQDEFWALDDVSFELKKGEILGIIGMNGSGKTTMLKLLNGIFWPDKGKIEIRGRVGALIAVGAGFHPNLTGRENIYLNGAILGMNKDEINQKIDKIIEFADIGEFIDMPVKFYSSGMSVRLGFSSAIFIEPEVLLIDEVLAVGDAGFRNKCLRKIEEIKAKCSVILVTHSLLLLQNICRRALLLNKGKLEYSGDATKVAEKYEEIIFQNNKVNQKVSNQESNISGQPFPIVLSAVKVNGEFDDQIHTLFYKSPVEVSLTLKTKQLIKDPYFTIIFQNSEKQNFAIAINRGEQVLPDLMPGEYKIVFSCDKFNLLPGIYTINVNVGSGGYLSLAKNYSGISFQIKRTTVDGKKCDLLSGQGAVRLEGVWKIQ